MTINVGVNWTYSGDPRASDLDMIRFIAGDTDSRDPIWSDDEVLGALQLEGNTRLAAAMLLEQGLATGTFSEISVGDLRLGGDETVEWISARIRQLRARGSYSAKPYAGGLSRSRKQDFDLDSDLPSKAFERGRFDHPETHQMGDGRGSGYRHRHPST